MTRAQKLMASQLRLMHWGKQKIDENKNWKDKKAVLSQGNRAMPQLLFLV